MCVTEGLLMDLEEWKEPSRPKPRVLYVVSQNSVPLPH